MFYMNHGTKELKENDARLVNRFMIMVHGNHTRPLAKSVYRRSNFLISGPKHMLWVLKRTVSMRRFF